MSAAVKGPLFRATPERVMLYTALANLRGKSHLFAMAQKSETFAQFNRILISHVALYERMLALVDLHLHREPLLDGSEVKRFHKLR